MFGVETMQNMMASMRANPFTNLGCEKFVKVRDLMNYPTLPKSIVLQFYLESDKIISVCLSRT